MAFSGPGPHGSFNQPFFLLNNASPRFRNPNPNIPSFNTSYPQFRGSQFIPGAPIPDSPYRQDGAPGPQRARNSGGPGPQRKMNMNGHRFNPTAASAPMNKSDFLQIAERAKKTLMSYGLKEWELKKLPPVLLGKFNPFNCDLCDAKCDGVNIAKMHYKSKLHARNVENYMLERSSMLDAGSNKLIQISGVQGRHISCELCYVQFTSKTHMESHYNGKSHLATVLGRKKPKKEELLLDENKMLLKQLIEREKPYMLEKQAEKAKTKPAVIETKPGVVDPSLLCLICNVSTTNEEQMICHKNGKKHLTKERDRILDFCHDY